MRSQFAIATWVAAALAQSLGGSARTEAPSRAIASAEDPCVRLPAGDETTERTGRQEAPGRPRTVTQSPPAQASTRPQEPGENATRGRPQWKTDGPDRGLPVPGARWLPWSDEPDHPANRAFRLCWVADLVPAEVAFALPREHERAKAAGPEARYFGKREGQEADRRTFGGDGMQLPRESFRDAESAALREALQSLDGDELDRLRSAPSSCVWLQNDLLRTARRLLDTGSNPELLAPLLAAARRLALPRATITDPELTTFVTEQASKLDESIDANHLVEVERRSTRLFDAEKSLLWSRVHLQWPAESAPSISAVFESIARGDKPTVPAGARAILAQGIVALDDQGNPCATPLVVDVRLQHFVGFEGEQAKATTTRDGVDFRVFWLERETLRRQGGKATLEDFRRLHDDDQALFRDYGTLKHTTLAGQCALCHRTTGTPEPELAGFPLLRKNAQPAVAASPRARLELAERQFARFLAELEAAAKASSITTR